MSSSTVPFTLLADCPLDLFDTNTPVAELLTTTALPPMDPITPDAVAFSLSTREPYVNLQELRKRAVPCSLVLSRTVDALRRPYDNPVRSILDSRFSPPLPTPVWMLRYWMRIDTATKARSLWRKVHAGLVELMVSLPDGADTEAAREDVTLALTTTALLPWHDEMCSRPRIHTRDLVVLLSGQPLDNTVVDIMLHVLRADFASHHPHVSSNITILNPALHDVLREITWDDVEAPEQQALVSLARRLAAPLVDTPPRAQKVYLPWVSEGSWRLYVLDTRHHTIRHGDMQGAPGPAADLLLIRRWIRLSSPTSWDVRDNIPYGGPEDGASCGFAMVNAIRHDCVGEPLWTVATRDLCRVRAYARVINYIVRPTVRFRRGRL